MTGSRCLTGKTRIELIAGANLHAAAGIYLGHRLFGELAVPVYQDLDGPQRGVQWRGAAGCGRTCTPASPPATG